MMDSHQTRGVLNLSVPVLGPDGNAIAALTCPFLSRIDRSDAPGARSVIESLKHAGHELSQISGGPDAG
jgi:DNA-binding IclR family transcriptional regulator